MKILKLINLLMFSLVLVLTNSYSLPSADGKELIIIDLDDSTDQPFKVDKIDIDLDNFTAYQQKGQVIRAYYDNDYFYFVPQGEIDKVYLLRNGQSNFREVPFLEVDIINEGDKPITDFQVYFDKDTLKTYYYKRNTKAEKGDKVFLFYDDFNKPNNKWKETGREGYKEWETYEDGEKIIRIATYSSEPGTSIKVVNDEIVNMPSDADGLVVEATGLSQSYYSKDIGIGLIKKLTSSEDWVEDLYTLNPFSYDDKKVSLIYDVGHTDFDYAMPKERWLFMRLILTPDKEQGLIYRVDNGDLLFNKSVNINLNQLTFYPVITSNRNGFFNNYRIRKYLEGVKAKVEGDTIIVTSPRDVKDMNVFLDITDPIYDIVDPNNKHIPFCYEHSNKECDNDPEDIKGVWIKANLTQGENVFKLKDAELKLDITNKETRESIKFCYEDQNNECGNYVEDYKGVWVKIEKMLEKGDKVTLLFSRVEEDESVSPDEVFDFYEDFKKGIDENKWETKGSPIVENGVLKVAQGSGVKSKVFTLPNNLKYKINYRIKADGATRGGVRFASSDEEGYKEWDYYLPEILFWDDGYLWVDGGGQDKKWKSYDFDWRDQNLTYEKGVFEYWDKGEKYNEQRDNGEDDYHIYIYSSSGTGLGVDYIYVIKDINISKEYKEVSDFRYIYSDVEDYLIKEGEIDSDIAEGGSYYVEETKRVNGSITTSPDLAGKNATFELYINDTKVANLTNTTEGGASTVIIVGDGVSKFNFEDQLKNWGLEKGKEYYLNGVFAFYNISDFLIGDFLYLNRTFYTKDPVVEIRVPKHLTFKKLKNVTIFYRDVYVEGIKLDGDYLTACQEEEEDEGYLIICNLTEEDKEIEKGYHNISVEYYENGNLKEKKEDFYVTMEERGDIAYWVDVLNITNLEKVGKSVKVDWEFKQNNTFPLYKIVISWGDGINQTVHLNEEEKVEEEKVGTNTHTYKDYGIYDIQILAYLGNSTDYVIVGGEKRTVKIDGSSSGSQEGGGDDEEEDNNDSGGSNTQNSGVYNDIWKEEMDKWREYLFILLGIFLYWLGLGRRIQIGGL